MSTKLKSREETNFLRPIKLKSPIKTEMHRQQRYLNIMKTIIVSGEITILNSGAI